jgi:simple sugar transport system permease protein
MLVTTMLKIRRNANEAVVSLLLNFVILLGIQMAINGTAGTWEASASRVVERTGAYTGLIVALSAAAAMAVLLRLTVWGLQIRVMAENRHAARFVGIPDARLTMQVGLVSGALAGVGGAIVVAGGYAVSAATPLSGIGYAGIVVAVLAGRSVAGVVAMGIVIAGFFAGARGSAAQGALALNVEDVFLAVALTLCLIGSGLARYRVVFMRMGKATP